MGEAVLAAGGRPSNTDPLLRAPAGRGAGETVHTGRGEGSGRQRAGPRLSAGSREAPASRLSSQGPGSSSVMRVAPPSQGAGAV